MMTCRIRILILLGVICSVATSSAFPPDDSVKVAFNFASWPGITASIKQPIDATSVAETYLGTIEEKIYGDLSGYIRGTDGEVFWKVFETSEAAKYDLIERFKYSSMLLEDCAESYTILTNTIGDVALIPVDTSESKYIRNFSRNNFSLGLALYTDSLSANQFAASLVSLIDSSPITVSLDASSSIPAIGDLDLSADPIIDDSTAIIRGELTINSNIEEIIERKVTVMVDSVYYDHKSTVTTEGLQFSMYGLYIAGADEVSIIVRLQNVRGESASRSFTYVREE